MSDTQAPDAAMTKYLANITGRRATSYEARRELKREKLHCTWCGKRVPKGRQTWCSKGCVNEWWVRCDPTFARAKVDKRDCGVCAACGIDTDRIKRLMKRLDICNRPRWEWDSTPWPGYPRRKERFEMAVALLSVWIGRRLLMGHYEPIPHLWEMDHIVPVIEGGGGCGLDGLRTLCIPCHHKQTAQLAARRARNVRTKHC